MLITVDMLLRADKMWGNHIAFRVDSHRSPQGFGSYNGETAFNPTDDNNMAAQAKKKIKLTAEAQSDQFKEIARMLNSDETGLVFDAAFRGLVPPKPRREIVPRRK